MLNKFNLFLILSFFTSCSYSTFYVPNERLVYHPTDPSTVIISTQKTVKQPYKILGRVATLAMGGGESAREELQQEAARIGANMVIDLRIERGFGRTSASGLAILLTQGGEVQ